jgi:hypothetical protein
MKEEYRDHKKSKRCRIFNFDPLKGTFKKISISFQSGETLFDMHIFKYSD